MPDKIGLKYVPPTLPFCITSLGVKFGLKLGKSLKTNSPYLFFLGIFLHSSYILIFNGGIIGGTLYKDILPFN